MKKTINQSHLEGLLYEHKLQLRETGPNSKSPGTKYIAGSIDVATNDDCTNIVTVHYTYVTATTAKGSANPAYVTLMNILDGKIGTVMSVGQDKAAKVRIDSAIGLNEFYTVNRTTQVEELVSTQRNDGGFIHVVDRLTDDLSQRNVFKVDMLITNVVEIPEDPDKGLSRKVEVRGAIFDFKGALLPVKFSAIDPGAMNYFLKLDVSGKNPVFTWVRGTQVSETIVRKYVEENAWGEDWVREVPYSRKDFVLIGASKTPYPWDDPEFITAKDVTDAMAAREVYLATVKQRYEEAKARQSQETTFTASAGTSTEFQF